MKYFNRRILRVLVAIGGFAVMPILARASEAPGTLDTGFSSPMANLYVVAIAVQPDKKIIIGGWFYGKRFTTKLEGHLARLNTDGSTDTNLVVFTGTSGIVRALALRPDGGLVFGGDFWDVYGGDGTNRTIRPNLAQADSNGLLDSNFSQGSGPNGPVICLALQPDGKVLIGGAFPSVNGTNRSNIARLNSDRSLDLDFEPGTGGDFASIAGVNRSGIGRLNPDGSLDVTFDPGKEASRSVNSIAVQSDGKVLIGGRFTSQNQTVPTFLARLYGDSANLEAIKSLDANARSLDANAVRGANAIRVTIRTQGTSSWVIEASTNSTDWTPVLTNSPTGGLIEFSDKDASQFPRRFYRAQQARR